MPFATKIQWSEVMFPEIYRHLEGLPEKKRAERIRALANAAFMLERGDWTIVPKQGAPVLNFVTPAAEPSGFRRSFRENAAL